MTFISKLRGRSSAPSEQQTTEFTTFNTENAKKEITSPKDLPKTFYQIKDKFRDEIRPRFGVMRAREFLMKDAYSFDIDEDSMHETYLNMKKIYKKIFD